MFKNLITLRLIAFLAIIAFIPGCKCTCDDPSDPECKNYDPCYGVEPKLTGDFKIYEYLDAAPFYGPDIVTELGDSISKSIVIFRADDENAESYEWHIGSGVYTKREFTLNFRTADYGISIPVSLTVKKKPNYSCHPDADSVITTQKTIYNDSFVSSGFFGDWAGYYLDTPGFKDTLSIIDYPQREVGVYGVFPKIDSILTDKYSRIYGLYFESAANHNKSDVYLKGYCYVNKTKDSITFFWKGYQGDGLDWPGERTFKGWRIP